ncbi:transcriptional regulator, TetR family [Luteibacter sp. UNCMF331Sha3.1]|uniref:TetR/AcrR family transcriptional regulator n=1 Tax=Luteibacter sp. UNCMF331Sha3.1 TaxID=1502760 RepID=UPI0008D4EBFC|nr:TetR/AcrR family transcriptional regulator [Luteibacter sp. UNCMF331Sha3.1]SEN11742.1 transcriptional regulator, TetR family [Luteibacter sp. UNCMF331Sha3.1]
MRYPKDQREKTRKHIVSTAARRFRAHGLEEGIASIMQAAGLTNGAFSNHFASKHELIKAALDHAMQERVDRLNGHIVSGRGVEGLLRGYFSRHHRDGPADGCATSSLAGEIARQPTGLREAFTGGVTGFVELLARQWPTLESQAARHRALALYGLMAGTLQVARATDDEALSREVLDAGLAAALRLAEDPQG